MVMLSATSALVAGSVAAEANMTQKVQVVRPFWFGGKAHQAGSVVDVPDGAAAELIGMRKAVKYNPPPPKPAPAPRVEAKSETKEQSK